MSIPVHESSGNDRDECFSCSGRRAFLRDALGAAIALVGLSTLTPIAEIAALEPRVARGAVRYPLPAGDSVTIDKTHEVILCRSGTEVFAFALSCPHQSSALRALPGTAGFQCPRHKSRYQPNGTFISGRATRNMDRLPITRDGDVVVVDPEVSYESDVEPAKWAAAVVRV